MKYEELAAEIEGMSGENKQVYERLLMLTGIANQPWRQFSEILEAATGADDFFESVYQSKSCSKDALWAAWAKIKRKDWLQAFDPVKVIPDVTPTRDGILLESETMDAIVPLHRHSKKITVFIFDDGAFNEAVPEYCCCVKGSFKIENNVIEDGTYDVYRDGSKVILEKWKYDIYGNRIANSNRNKMDAL